MRTREYWREQARTAIRESQRRGLAVNSVWSWVLVAVTCFAAFGGGFLLDRDYENQATIRRETELRQKAERLNAERDEWLAIIERMLLMVRLAPPLRERYGD